MKLPKPGKIRAPKLEGKKLPTLGKIHIKNRFLQKNLISLIVVAVLAIGTGTVYGTLSSQDADKGEDPVYGVNPDRYQVLLSGEGFKLSKQQEKDYKLQKKQNEVNAANDTEDPDTFNYSNGSRIFRPGSNYRYRYNRYNSRYNTYKPTKTPRITSNITDQITMESSWKAGDTLKFRVSAYAYPYGVKNTISSKNIKVSVMGGKEAKLYREKNGYCFYSVELAKGMNKITITATDKKEKKSATLGPYIISAGKSKTSKSDKPDKPDKPENSGDNGDNGNSGNNGSSNTDPTQNTDNPGTETKTKTVAVSANYSDDAIDLKGDVSEDLTLKEALQEMGVEFDESKIIYVPGKFNLDKFDSQLKEYYRVKLNGGEDVDEEDSEYLAWLSDVKESMKDGIGKECPFDSTHWTYASDLNAKVKDLASDVKLTLVLYED